jgi:hypothetical protein
VGGGIQAASAYVAPGPCTAGFVDEHPDTSSSVIYALPTPGCATTGYTFRFSLWSTQSDVYATSFPQTMLQDQVSTNPAGPQPGGWTLSFTNTEDPTCYFQVDFGYLHPRKGPGGSTWQYTTLGALMGVIPGCTP